MTYDSNSDIRIYLISVYFIISTIATVGYGDVSAITPSIDLLTQVEKCVNIVLIMFGVWIYTNSISLVSGILNDPR